MGIFILIALGIAVIGLVWGWFGNGGSDGSWWSRDDSPGFFGNFFSTSSNDAQGSTGPLAGGDAAPCGSDSSSPAQDAGGGSSPCDSGGSSGCGSSSGGSSGCGSSST